MSSAVILIQAGVGMVAGLILAFRAVSDTDGPATTFDITMAVLAVQGTVVLNV